MVFPDNEVLLYKSQINTALYVFLLNLSNVCLPKCKECFKILNSVISEKDPLGLFAEAIFLMFFLCLNRLEKERVVHAKNDIQY